jgi:hypothetical protein
MGLVGSTEIAAQLDPEEWREVIAAYHRAAAEIHQPFAFTTSEGARRYAPQDAPPLLGCGCFGYGNRGSWVRLPVRFAIVLVMGLALAGTG